MIYKHQYFQLNTQSKKVFDENNKELYLTGNSYRMLNLLCEKGPLNLTEIGEYLDRAKDFTDNTLRQYRHKIKTAIGRDIVEYKNQIYSIVGKVEGVEEKERNTLLLRPKEYDESISKKLNKTTMGLTIMNQELKSLKDYCEYYFNHFTGREVMIKVMEERYKEIRKNNFYLDKDGETFKNEVLKFWEGGYTYKTVFVRTRNDRNRKIDLLNRDGNILNPDEILIELENNNLDLHGNYTLSQMHSRGGDVTKNMAKLSDAMDCLLNDKIDIKERYNKVIKSDGDLHIKGMGHARATMFLHINKPNAYSIWDSLTEKTFNILSRVDNSFLITVSDEAEKFKFINERLGKLLNELDNKELRYGFINRTDVEFFIWFIALWLPQCKYNSEGEIECFVGGWIKDRKIIQR